MTTNNQTTPHAPDDIRELEDDLAHQREQLAHTVQNLHDRLDVKTRAQQRAHEVRAVAEERAHDLKERATADSGRPRHGLVAAGVAVLAAVPVAYTTWRKWRKS